MKNAKLLTVVIVLQSMILAGQWLGGGASFVTPAHAQVPDAGGQRLEIIGQLKALNEKVDRLHAFLESGKLEVRSRAADENKAGRR
jgi:hypothetical protein